MADTLAPDRDGTVAGVDLAACTLAYGPNTDRACWWCGGPVPGGRMEWCSQACERAFEEAHVWSRARAAALARAAHRCAAAACKVRHDVEVHHRTPVGPRGYGVGCQHHGDNLLVLCGAHHDEQHRRMRPGRQMPLFVAA